MNKKLQIIKTESRLYSGDREISSSPEQVERSGAITKVLVLLRKYSILVLFPFICIKGIFKKDKFSTITKLYTKYWNRIFIINKYFSCFYLTWGKINNTINEINGMRSFGPNLGNNLKRIRHQYIFVKSTILKTYLIKIQT